MLLDVHRRIVNAKYILERGAMIQQEGHEMSIAVSMPSIKKQLSRIQ